MGDCIPSGSLNGVSISALPPSIKGPIIGLSVVFSVVVVVSVIVVVFLVRKISNLKKVGGEIGGKIKTGGINVAGDIEGGIEGGVDVGLKGVKDVKGKLPDVDINRNINVSVDVDVDASARVAGEIATRVKGALDGAIDGALSADLRLGLDVESPFFSVFNALPYASLLLNANGVIVKANPAAKLKWGYNIGDLEGKLQYKVLVSPKEVEVRLGQIDALVKGKIPSFEIDGFDVRADGGAQIEVEVIGSLIRILGKVYVFLITGHVCFTKKGERYKDD